MENIDEIKSPLSLLNEVSGAIFSEHDNPDKDITKITTEDDKDEDGVTDLDPKPKDHDEEEIPEHIKSKLDKPVKKEESDDDSNDETEDETEDTEDKKQKEDDKDNNDEQDKDTENDTDDEVDEDETTAVSNFFDVFAEALNVEVDEENKPDSIEALTDWVRDLIDENSKPTYSSEQVKNLDDYIKNGGKFEDYYNQLSKGIDYDNIDMENEDNQKTIIKEYLKKEGYSDTQINKKINRFEETGLLEDEANDALEILDKKTKQENEEVLKNQEALKQQQVKQQKEFYDGLTNDINNLQAVKEIKIPKEDRPKLLNYLFKSDANGVTQYQKDWQKDVKKNLIESAYFMMKGDQLLKSASRSGETSAVKKLKQSFKTEKGNRSQTTVSSKQSTPVFKAAASILGSI